MPPHLSLPASRRRVSLVASPKHDEGFAAVQLPWLARIAPWLLFPPYAAAALIIHRLSAPIAQDPAYHAFADMRIVFGIPNFADVASNVAILWPALAGLVLVQRADAPMRFGTAVERAFALLFFAALLATAFGSGWYHLAPDNDRLLLDRLPIGLAFTAFLAWLTAERTRLRGGGIALLLPWLAVGPASVLWWYAGEIHGEGDLRPYLLLYLFVFLATPLLLSLPTAYSRARAYWWAYLAFALGMACDRLDHAIWIWLDGWISGHTLKHLLMGLALALLVRMLARRRLRFR